MPAHRDQPAAGRHRPRRRPRRGDGAHGRGRRRLRLLGGLDRPRRPRARPWAGRCSPGAASPPPPRCPGDDDARRAYDPAVLLAAPPVAPSGLLNPRHASAPSTRSGSARRRSSAGASCSRSRPSGTRSTWSRAGTGSTAAAGFLQWQYAVPFGAEAVVRRTVQRLSDRGCAVVRERAEAVRTGQPGSAVVPDRRLDPGSSTCPAACADSAGCSTSSTTRWSRPAGASTWPRTAACGPSCCALMYPRLDEWQEVRARVDPDGRLRSDLARRRPGPCSRPRCARSEALDPGPGASIWGSSSSRVAVVVDHEVGPGQPLLAGRLTGDAGPGVGLVEAPLRRPGARPPPPGRRRPPAARPCRRGPTRPAGARRAPPRGRRPPRARAARRSRRRRPGGRWR